MSRARCVSNSPHMNRLPLLAAAILSLSLTGCMTATNSSAGGIAATTVTNTNLGAITDAANSVFADSGYSVGPVNYPDSISFDKPAGGFGQAMWGGYNQTTTYRAKLRMIPLSGSDYRLAVSVSVVNDAGQAGFEDARPVLGLWSAEFIPLLNKIKAQASNAGSGY